MNKLIKKQNGFTLVELLIATSIFAIMMLIATSAILHIGKIYYKGAVVSRTQDTSRAIIEDISRNIQTGGNKTITSAPGAVCVGYVRYSFVLNTQLTLSGPLGAGQARHVLWVDRILDTVPCQTANMVNPATDANRNTSFTGRELIGANMRLTNFDVAPPPTSARPVRLFVKIVYGDFDLSPGNTCISSRFGGQFCATSEITTFVKSRL